MIRLAVKEPAVQARRLDSGYYVRTVEITEVRKRTDASRVKEQQLLAMANIARMLNLGGIFLANNVLPAQHTNDLEYLGRRTTAYTPTGAYGDDVVVYRRR